MRAPSAGRFMRESAIALVAAACAAAPALANDTSAELATGGLIFVQNILRTGANWSGPIGQFHLTVDKGEPASLVSFCGQGVKKTSDTKFEMGRTNFSPDGDLALLILKKMPSQ